MNINFKEFVKKKLDSGEGSYLYLMIFQDYCQRTNVQKEMSYTEWEHLLEDFGNRPTKEVFENWF